MFDHPVCADYELLCVIVNSGMGSKVIHAAKHLGIKGGTVILGKGTVHQRILEALGLTDIRKEIVIMVAALSNVLQAMESLTKEFQFNRRNHGIAFSIPVASVVGACRNEKPTGKQERDGDSFMYQMITVIVNKGDAENVIEAAEKAGSTGGTIINGRGSGIHETSKLFSMEIEPEKEIVMIITQINKAENIITSICSQLKINEPGSGILFVQDITKVYGLYE